MNSHRVEALFFPFQEYGGVLVQERPNASHLESPAVTDGDASSVRPSIERSDRQPAVAHQASLELQNEGPMPSNDDRRIVGNGYAAVAVKVSTHEVAQQARMNVWEFHSSGLPMSTAMANEIRSQGAACQDKQRITANGEHWLRCFNVCPKQDYMGPVLGAKIQAQLIGRSVLAFDDSPVGIQEAQPIGGALVVNLTEELLVASMDARPEFPCITERATSHAAPAHMIANGRVMGVEPCGERHRGMSGRVQGANHQPLFLGETPHDSGLYPYQVIGARQ